MTDKPKKEKTKQKRSTQKNKTETSGQKKKAPNKPSIIRDAPETQYFILCNGQPVKNVKELADQLEDLRDEVFYHHVNRDKNDFATWINDVFKEVELAEDLANVKDKDHVRIVLYKHIANRLAKKK